LCRDWTIVSGAERRVYVPCVERPLRSLQLSLIWLSIEERVVPLEPAVISTSYAYVRKLCCTTLIQFSTHIVVYTDAYIVAFPSHGTYIGMYIATSVVAYLVRVDLNGASYTGARLVSCSFEVIVYHNSSRRAWPIRDGWSVQADFIDVPRARDTSAYVVG
jgi:hypothetical protein